MNAACGAIYSLDFEALEGLLKDWPTENCDPVWMMRKAAILARNDRIDDAYELSKRALSTIRQSPADPRSVAGPSREGWALWLAMEFDEMRVEERARIVPTQILTLIGEEGGGSLHH